MPANALDAAVTSMIALDRPIVGIRAPEEFHAAALRAGPPAVVAIYGANDPRFDAVKAELFELGVIGNGGALAPGPVWLGMTQRVTDAELTAARRHRTLFICFYTRNTPYEAEAARLRATLEHFALDHEIVAVDPFRSWDEACLYKPHFIREMWATARRPIMWVDADATVERAPLLLDANGADFAAHKWQWNEGEYSRVHKWLGWEMCGGSLFFNATAAAGHMLELWCKRCAADPSRWDQMHLDAQWCDLTAASPLRTIWLPRSYLQIHDAPVDPDDPPVITQWQASRHLKAQVSGGERRAKPPVDRAVMVERAYSRFPQPLTAPPPSLRARIARRLGLARDA